MRIPSESWDPSLVRIVQQHFHFHNFPEILSPSLFSAPDGANIAGKMSRRSSGLEGRGFFFVFVALPGLISHRNKNHGETGAFLLEWKVQNIPINSFLIVQVFQKCLNRFFGIPGSGELPPADVHFGSQNFDPLLGLCWSQNVPEQENRGETEEGT